MTKVSEVTLWCSPRAQNQQQSSWFHRFGAGCPGRVAQPEVSKLMVLKGTVSAFDRELEWAFAPSACYVKKLDGFVQVLLEQGGAYVAAFQSCNEEENRAWRWCAGRERYENRICKRSIEKWRRGEAIERESIASSSSAHKTQRVRGISRWYFGLLQQLVCVQGMKEMQEREECMIRSTT